MDNNRRRSLNIPLEDIRFSEGVTMDPSRLLEPNLSSGVPTLSTLLPHHSNQTYQRPLPGSAAPPNTSSFTPPAKLSILHPSPSSFPMSTFSTNDLANLENMLLWSVQEPNTIVLTVMYCLSFILGFIGNLMSLRVLTNRHSRRLASVNATRNLLVNLAVCDLAVVCVCMPITMGSQIYTAWVYGDFLCRAVPFTQAVSVSASVLTLTVISVNRYYSVKSPLEARSMFTRRRILATVVTVWIVSSAICAPIAVMNRRREISIGTFVILVCQEEWPEARLKQGYNVLLFVMLYCIPVTFNLTIGFLTGRRLGVGKKSLFADLDPRSQALHTLRLKTRQKIAKMVVCLVLLFAVSWLPLYLTDLWIDCELRPPSWLLQARPFAQWLGLTNSSLNPICYCFIGDLYRSAKVIRSQYYKKVAGLFGTASFSRSSAVASTATVLTSINGTKTEGRNITAATAVASASMVTIPRFLLARSQLKAQHTPESPLGSNHSISDWCQSSPVDWEGSLFPFQSPKNKPDFEPGRRHSVEEDIRSLPLQMAPMKVDMLPLRRHSVDRLYTQSTGFKDPDDTDCHQLSGDHTFAGEEEFTDLTSL